MSSLKGKNAVVTGSTSGIGRGIAIELAKHGANIIVTGRNREAGLEVVKNIIELGRQAYFIQADISNYRDINRLYEFSLGKYSEIHILINNAGVEILRSIDETDVKDLEYLYRVNLFAPFYLMKLFIPHMREIGGGVIINISSTAGLSPYPGGGAYCSSKAALISLSKVAALENAKYGIRVIALAPGLVETRMLYEGVKQSERSEYLETILNKIPLGRFAKPIDLARVVVFLCSDEAWYITGSTIVVDGGLITGRRESGNVPPRGRK